MSQSLHKCLGRYGYTVNKDQLTEDQIKTIKKELTVTTTVLPAYKDFQKPKVYKIFYQNKQSMYLPRFYALEKFGEPDYIALSKGQPLDPKCQCIYDALSHQKTAILKLESIFDNSKQIGDGGVLSLPCGYGKTFCAIKTVCTLRKCALIVVPTECLMDQWMDAIRTFAPNASVGYIQKDHIDVDGRDFVVAMLHSICLKSYPAKTFDRFGITVFDECHHISSETFKESMMRVRTKFTLGLSATPNRRDGLSDVFYKFIGPLFHKEKRAGLNQVLVKKIHLYSDSENYQILRMTNGTTNTSGITTAISKLHGRNLLIIHVLHDLIKQGRRILLISSRKQHLHDLKDLLDSRGIRDPTTGKFITYGFYYGKQGMSRKAHKELLARSSVCDIVLGIDAIAKEGLDIPDRNTLIWATPPGIDVEQPVGRILRKFHKDLNPIVIDIVDHTGNYVSHSKLRDQWYKDEDYLIHEHNVELSKSWGEQLTDYVHRKKVTNFSPVIKKKVKEEPSNIICLLGDENGVMVTPKKSIKPKSMKTMKPTKPKTTSSDSPSNSLCLLADNVTSNKTESRNKPKSHVFDKCII